MMTPVGGRLSGRAPSAIKVVRASTIPCREQGDTSETAAATIDERPGDRPVRASAAAPVPGLCQRRHLQIVLQAEGSVPALRLPVRAGRARLPDRIDGTRPGGAADHLV